MTSTCTMAPPKLGLSWHEDSESSLCQHRANATMTILGSYLALFGAEPNGESDTDSIGEYQECPLASFGAETVYEPSPRRPSTISSSQQLIAGGDQQLQSPPRFAHALQRLQCSTEDLKMLADNQNQFDLLKRSLRKRGAVTNEVLKQKLPLFLSYSKSRRRMLQPNGLEYQTSGASAA